MANGECSKHPGTKFVTLTTAKGLEYRACPTCKTEKEAARLAAPPLPSQKTSSKKTPSKNPAKKTPAKKTAAVPYVPGAPAKKVAAKQATEKRGIFARFGMGRRG